MISGSLKFSALQQEYYRHIGIAILSEARIFPVSVAECSIIGEAFSTWMEKFPLWNLVRLGFDHLSQACQFNYA